MPEWHVGELFKRDEKRKLMNLVSSEFLPLELFWVLLQSKVPNESCKVYRLNTWVKPEYDEKLFVKFLIKGLPVFLYKYTCIAESWLFEEFRSLCAIFSCQSIANSE